MPDQLRNLSDQRDRANASRSRLEPERLVLPPRNTVTRLVCIACRRAVDGLGHRNQWRAYVDNLPWSEQKHAKYSPPTECPECKGQLVEVTG